MTPLPFALTLDTWLISDTHWGHGNIVKYANRPANHNELMIGNWRERVMPDDVVVHIGDVAMTSSKLGPLYRQIRDLPGQKYLLRGNHDTNTNKFYQDRLGFNVLPFHRPSRGKNNFQGAVIYATVHDCSGADCPGGCTMARVALSHVPCWYDHGEWDVNIHGHIHNNGYPPAIRDNGFGGRNYRNICVEQVGYSPQRLRDIVLGKAGTTPAEDGWNEHDPDSRIQI